MTRIAHGWRYTRGWRCCSYGLLGRRSLVLIGKIIAHGWRYRLGWRVGCDGLIGKRGLIVVGRAFGFGLRSSR